MTNSESNKELHSKLFYGNARRSNSVISKSSNKLYISPAERQMLREKREVLKAMLQNTPYENVKTSLVSEKKITISPNLQENISSEGKQLERFFPIFYSNSSPNKSPKPKTSTVAMTSDTVAVVSPQALHISLPGTPKTRRCVPVRDSPKRHQAVIDAGQKKIGANQCGLCGMVYTINLPHDQEQHAAYHKRFLDSVKFNGWKNERVVASFTNGRILKILPSDPKYAVKKVNEICSVIDADLGFENHINFSTSTSKIIYLFITDSRQVAGCVVAEPISHAFRLLTSASENHAVSTCARFSEPAACGVSRIWTYYPYRRRGIATRLVDALRSTFVLGAFVQINQIAFSDPTADGIKFASHYCKTESFLTYNFTGRR